MPVWAFSSAEQWFYCKNYTKIVHGALLIEAQLPRNSSKPLLAPAGWVRCSASAAASQGHRDWSTASIHQHHLPGICPLPADGEKLKPFKNGAAGSSCLIPQEWDSSPHHKSLQLFNQHQPLQQSHHTPILIFPPHLYQKSLPTNLLEHH